MNKINGPSIFLTQLIDHQAPPKSLKSIAHWVSNLGFRAIQIPCSCNPEIFNLAKAAESKTYCDDILGILSEAGIQISELSTHFEGQLVTSHSSTTQICDAFAPAEIRGNDSARTAWARRQLSLAAKASRNLGLGAHVTCSGSLATPLVSFAIPATKIVDDALVELGRRWTPILDEFDEAGVDLCFELSDGQDLRNGITFKRFLELTKKHQRAKVLYDPSQFVLRGRDYLQFIDDYHSLIRAFRVKDALYLKEKGEAYCGAQTSLWPRGWVMPLDEGQVEFAAIFSRLAHYDYPGWAVLSWEYLWRFPEETARRGAAHIRNHIIRAGDRQVPKLATV